MRVRILAAVCLLVLVAGVTLGSYRLGQQSTGGSAVAPDELPSEFNAVAELYQRVSNEAVEVPSDDKLAEAAAEGMLGALEDPYSAYYTPDEFAELNNLLEGQFSGVGLVLEDTPQGFEAVSVIEGTPAAKAGIESGERIISVNGSDVTDQPIDSVVNRVKGEKGTEVTLGLTGGEAGEREVTLTRARIEVPTLESRVLDSGAGYVRLLQFTETAGEDVRGAVKELRAEGAERVVLDLRGNPGGLLREAVDVAGVFIEDGTVVSVKDRENSKEQLSATGEAFEGMPLAVLIDDGSASASEIVAGAVKDLDRGVVVGQKTFGKGTVQTVRVLADGSGAKFTTAEYFTPSGDSLEDKGVTPDRKVTGSDAQLDAAVEALQGMVAGTGG
jgi:carboxyl-terminal processing protease